MPGREDNPPELDRIYGLDPVIEPGDGEAAPDCAGLQPRTVLCPYCGEPFETVLDLSAGSTSYMEDCQVCCQPIEFRIEVAEDGASAALETRRSD